MLSEAGMNKLLEIIPPDNLAEIMEAFSEGHSTSERVQAVTSLLQSGGESWRNEIGEWIAALLSVEQLVPETHSDWRPLVHHCMAYVSSHISDARLAPKIVEQVELPPDTPVEKRLGLIIAKTPGLQKLGQVLARTRTLNPRLREELQKLENGIADVTAEKIHKIVKKTLERALAAYDVKLAPQLLSEASVSAVLEFSWLNPSTGEREEGVFKVMKPHVPVHYSEDLQLLQGLATDLAARAGEYKFASRQVVDTLEEVRLLLEREVDFRREQATLAEVNRVYPRTGARAPKPIPELCADTITAMSLERAIKVTDVLRDRPLRRRQVATRIVEALLADPIFSSEEKAVFHADPHAGNLMFNEQTNELIVLDWALTGRLTFHERRQVARLFIMMGFRDASGVRSAIHALASSAPADCERDREIIDRLVHEYFSSLPFVCSLGAVDAMRLLDRIGVEGVRFPASLVLIRKVVFTLDGVLHDVAGSDIRIDTVIAREFLTRWVKGFGGLPSPFRLADWLALQRSAVSYVTGLWAFSSSTPALQPSAAPESYTPTGS